MAKKRSICWRNGGGSLRDEEASRGQDYFLAATKSMCRNCPRWIQSCFARAEKNCAASEQFSRAGFGLLRDLWKQGEGRPTESLGGACNASAQISVYIGTLAAPWMNLRNER